MLTLSCKEIVFSGHAIYRMFERGITKPDIRMCLEQGDIIEEYPNDSPYPSALLLGFIKGRPIHIVLAIDTLNQSCTIVTAYEPKTRLWEDGFRKRRSQ